MKNATALFYDNYKFYKKITDRVIFENYLKNNYEKSYFYVPIFLIVIGMITNTFYFNTFMFYVNIIILFSLIVLYLFKTEKMLHKNISEVVTDYSKEIAANYLIFNRKYLRFLHFHHNTNTILSLSDMENIIEVADAKIANKNYNFLNSIVFIMIISLFVSQLANTFGAYTNKEAIMNFVYFSIALIYIRFIIFSTLRPENQRLTEFKEFMVDMKYIKVNKKGEFS